METTQRTPQSTNLFEDEIFEQGTANTRLDSAIYERETRMARRMPLVEVPGGREMVMYAAKISDYWYLYLPKILELCRRPAQLNLESTARFANTIIDSPATLL